MPLIIHRQRQIVVTVKLSLMHVPVFIGQPLTGGIADLPRGLFLCAAGDGNAMVFVVIRNVEFIFTSKAYSTVKSAQQGPIPEISTCFA